MSLVWVERCRISCAEILSFSSVTKSPYYANSGGCLFFFFSVFDKFLKILMWVLFNSWLSYCFMGFFILFVGVKKVNFIWFYVLCPGFILPTLWCYSFPLICYSLDTLSSFWSLQAKFMMKTGWSLCILLCSRKKFVISWVLKAIISDFGFVERFCNWVFCFVLLYFSLFSISS